MATVTGSSGIIKAVTSGGSAANIGEVQSYAFNSSADSIEDTAMGDSARTYKAGLKNHTLSVEARFDSSDSAQEDLVAGSEVDFEVNPEGVGTGTPVYTGSGVVTSSSFTATFDGMVDASFEVQVSGDYTKGVN
ncbi:MAG: phage tail tube protein [Bacteroidota bacterium]